MNPNSGTFDESGPCDVSEASFAKSPCTYCLIVHKSRAFSASRRISVKTLNVESPTIYIQTIGTQTQPTKCRFEILHDNSAMDLNRINDECRMTMIIPRGLSQVNI